MNYANIRKFDVSNGPNVRTTLFVSGCTNNCDGCFNKELQNFNYGSKWTNEIEEEFVSNAKSVNIKGINILGGEPMDQTYDDALYNLLKRLKDEVGKSIWIWSGYVYEDIIKDEKKMNILSLVDVLIDGKFEISKRDISLKYRGSSNQRVIDIKKSIEVNKVVEIEV